MLKIEHLKLNLPYAYQHEAKNIADLVARQLVEVDHTVFKDMPLLKVPRIHINPGTSSNEIAKQIVCSIKHSVGGAE